ncbi:MAG: hypothetical protein BEU00_02225 [Marine Group III euryarchaeote CG-Epi3]|jgi:hypothetical protein|uniref:Cohesin domain-containing protein n=1 Tax=Marine Group III euryarchaeote CG-Epi3 TaxID=1888997 RepID=A0A1J5UGX5_9ARCH|nr:MAG: hypothetical protein BEU00_02225 [Marine Group III euryarchaeote CG-Epi3]|tara:strand:- start:80 stop:619 length:540 start_codon:yes stop_codon:yes gene_type:complete
MGVFQKSLLALVAITLFLPLSNAEDNIYRVDGLPSDLHYSTGTVYELQITANDYDSIAAVTVGVTNGTLSLTNDFGADSADRFNLSSSEDGWTIFWKAPTESFSLGEGNAILTVAFGDDSEPSEIWALYEVVIRSPEIKSHSTSGVPDWANVLAWVGVSVTVLCTVAGSYVLRRDKPKH